MTVPDFQSLMRPLLEALADGTEHQISALYDELASSVNLSSEDRAARLGSGEAVFSNRVRFASLYLEHAGAVEVPRRGFRCITERGRKLIAQPGPVNISNLEQFPEYRDWRRAATSAGPESKPRTPEEEDRGPRASPEERMERAIEEHNRELQIQVKRLISKMDDVSFERLVLDVVRAMRYTGPRGRALALGGTGDGGVDGVIYLDAFGLERVYLQAKRWSKPVGSPEVNGFLGALDRKKATKGLLMTTSRFSREAPIAVEESSKRVELVDGDQLARLMIEYGVGVTVGQRYELKKVDGDYFLED